METIIERLAHYYREQGAVIAVSAFHNETPFKLLTDWFDLVLLVVSEPADKPDTITHYIKEGFRIQERRYSPESLQRRIVQGDNRNLMHWLLEGEILLDRNTYLEEMRHRLLEFPQKVRQMRLLKEFSAFLAAFLQSKEYLQEDHVLDAYSNILEALHHYARIVIIEEGFHPEVTVWKQVRRVNAGVYKLYEELTLSGETLKQRVELVQLACEFSVMSKLESCCRLILGIITEAGRPLTVGQLQKQIGRLRLNLPLILDRLVKKNLVREVAVPLDNEFSLLEIRYTK